MISFQAKAYVIGLWWVDPGWTPGAHQSRSITPSPQLDRGENNNERLMGRDKDRERSLTNYHHRHNRLNLGKLTQFIAKSQSRVMRNKTKSQNTFPPPLPSSQAQLNSWILYLSPTSPQWHRGMGNGGWDQFITRCFCRSFLLRGRTHQTLSLLQHGVLPMRDSCPQTSPT